MRPVRALAAAGSAVIAAAVLTPSPAHANGVLAGRGRAHYAVPLDTSLKLETLSISVDVAGGLALVADADTPSISCTFNGYSYNWIPLTGPPGPWPEDISQGRGQGWLDCGSSSTSSELHAFGQYVRLGTELTLTASGSVRVHGTSAAIGVTGEAVLVPDSVLSNDFTAAMSLVVTPV